MPGQLSCCASSVIPEIDIWRAGNLMLRRYDDRAIEESSDAPMNLQRRMMTTARQYSAASSMP
jgi:hypothetical protein